YFGELALLTKAPRRASIRSCGDGQTLLLWISRSDFEQSLGSLRELLLRNAAFRPASRALKQEEQLALASPLEQVFGLPGSARRLVLTVLV
ncbi:PKAR, partial [Symbiodinium sp. KB8]